jgi:hypothetical protein
MNHTGFLFFLSPSVENFHLTKNAEKDLGWVSSLVKKPLSNLTV